MLVVTDCGVLRTYLSSLKMLHASRRPWFFLSALLTTSTIPSCYMSFLFLFHRMWCNVLSLLLRLPFDIIFRRRLGAFGATSRKRIKGGKEEGSSLTLRPRQQKQAAPTTYHWKHDDSGIESIDDCNCFRSSPLLLLRRIRLELNQLIHFSRCDWPAENAFSCLYRIVTVY